jgi:hypothetical protein
VNVGRRCFYLARKFMHHLQSKLNSRWKPCPPNCLYTIWDMLSEWIKIKFQCQYSETFSTKKKKTNTSKQSNSFFCSWNKGNKEPYIKLYESCSTGLKVKYNMWTS